MRRGRTRRTLHVCAVLCSPSLRIDRYKRRARVFCLMLMCIRSEHASETHKKKKGCRRGMFTGIPWLVTAKSIPRRDSFYRETVEI